MPSVNYAVEWPGQQWRPGLCEHHDARHRQRRKRQPLRPAADRRCLSRRAADHDHRRHARHAHSTTSSASKRWPVRKARSTAPARNRERIRIITNKPDPERLCRRLRRRGQYRRSWRQLGYVSNGMVNIPLAENCRVRIVAWDEHDAGYIDNVHGTRTYPTSGRHHQQCFDGEERTTTRSTRSAARAALEIDLDDNWTITPTHHGARQRTATASSPTIRPSAISRSQHYFPEYAHDNWYQAALTVQGKIGNLDLVYSGGYMDRAINTAVGLHGLFLLVRHAVRLWRLYHRQCRQCRSTRRNTSSRSRSSSRRTATSCAFRPRRTSRLRLSAGLFYERQTHDILQDYKINGDFRFDFGSGLAGHDLADRPGARRPRLCGVRRARLRHSARPHGDGRRAVLRSGQFAQGIFRSLRGLQLAYWHIAVRRPAADPTPLYSVPCKT